MFRHEDGITRGLQDDILEHTWAFWDLVGGEQRIEGTLIRHMYIDLSLYWADIWLYLVKN